MSTQVQFRRGNTAQTSTFTGATAEITVDTDKKTIVVHDGSTAGGFPLARENSSNTAGSYANSAYATANSAASYANAAFAVANSDTSAANTGAAYANSAFAAANSASLYANAGFAVANSGSIYANSAFLQANTPIHTANSAALYANGAFTRANNSINANTGGTITGDITITGNLIIQGNTFTANAGVLTSNDTLFLLGTGNYTADALDVGFAAHYNAGTNAHTGFIRDVGTKEWYIFKNYTPEVGANNNININDASFTIDTLNANLKSTVITLKGIDLLPYVNNAYTAANTADTKAVNSGAYANSAFLAANTPTHVANSAASYANSGFAVANSGASYANSAFIVANNSLGIDTTQNTNITNAGTYANSAFLAANTPSHVANSAASYANGAFAQANTDFTNISISPSQTYGNSGYYPVITVSANGRINTVSTQVVTDPSAIAFAIALG